MYYIIMYKPDCLSQSKTLNANRDDCVNNCNLQEYSDNCGICFPCHI